MDSPWTWALVAMAIVTMALSYRVPRAWMWIGWGGASFFASTLFGDYVDRDLHPFFTLGCDALVCHAILVGYKENWELGVGLAFLVSVFTSLLMVGKFIHQDWMYASLLELCNLSAMIWISTTGIMEMIGRNEHSAFHSFRTRIRHARIRV